MSLQPSIELRFSPTDLNPGDLSRAGQFLGSPAQAIEASLGAARVMMVDRMKAELAAATGDVTVNKLVDIADLAWQATFWKFRKISAPVMADAYVRAYRRADAGDVPMAVVYDLADKHAEKIGDYFHASSKQAMVEGFNSYVNRRLASKAAASRVLDAYGLTSRQMGGYVSASASMDAKVNSREKRSVKAKVLDYVARSFRRRIHIFALQEEHNVDQQAQQFAWMWLIDKGRLNPAAEKVWITAHDEKVCTVCGPLHGQKVGVNEQFTTPDGLSFWTPGVHPNCRCHVRLLENRFTITKALRGGQLQQFNRKHPRDREGQFSDLPDQPRTTTPSLVDAEWLKAVEAELARQHEWEPSPQWESSSFGSSFGTSLGSDWGEEEEQPQRQTRRSKKQKRQKEKAPAKQEQVQPQKQTEPVVTPYVFAQESWTDTWTPEVVQELKEQNPALTTEQIALSSMAFDRAVKEIVEHPPVKTEEAIRNTIQVGGNPERGENLLYYWDSDQDVPEEEGMVQFSADQEWKRGRDGASDAKVRAIAAASHEVNTRLDGFLRDFDNEPTRHQGEEYVNLKIPSSVASELTGESLSGSQRIRLSADELREMLTATANKTPLPDLEHRPVWSAGDPREEVRGVVRAPAEVLMRGLGITPENFEQTIYVSSEGHSGFETGEGLEQISQDTGGALQGWQNPGDFEIQADSSGVTNQGPYRFVHVDPAVPVEKIPIDIADLTRSQNDWL